MRSAGSGNVTALSAFGCPDQFPDAIVDDVAVAAVPEPPPGEDPPVRRGQELDYTPIPVPLIRAPSGSVRSAQVPVRIVPVRLKVIVISFGESGTDLTVTLSPS